MVENLSKAGSDRDNPIKHNADWILNAVKIINDGVADKLTKDNITAYRVKDVIRIDVNTSK